jgi:protein-S-isoprenylcysteine O-methyltransferase Ste14
VTHGIFAWSRNPIYIALDLLVAGTFLLQGRLLFLILAAAIGALLHELILREETFLAQRYGETYRRYCARVRRYL